MVLFEQILVGILGVGIAFLFWPGVKAALKRSQDAENPDWMGALVPIGAVVLFIVLLVLIARH